MTGGQYNGNREKFLCGDSSKLVSWFTGQGGGQLSAHLNLRTCNLRAFDREYTSLLFGYSNYCTSALNFCLLNLTKVVGHLLLCTWLSGKWERFLLCGLARFHQFQVLGQPNDNY